MATQTLILTVKSRLAVLLAAVANTDFEYAPRTEPSGPRVITLGDARATREIPGFKAGRQKRNETWEQDVWIWVRDVENTTPEEADAAALAILDDIEDVIADDPDLSVDGLSWCVIKDVEADMPGVLENMWAVRWRVTLSLFAQLT